MEDSLAGFLLGSVLTALLAAGFFLIGLNGGRDECRIEHSVYDCNYVGQWVPAPPKQD